MQARRTNRHRTAALIAAIAVMMSIAGGYAPAQAADDPVGDQTTVAPSAPPETPPAETTSSETTTETNPDESTSGQTTPDDDSGADSTGTTAPEPDDETPLTEPGRRTADEERSADLAPRLLTAIAGVFEASDTTISTPQGIGVVVDLGDLLTNMSGASATFRISKPPTFDSTSFLLGDQLYYTPEPSFHGTETIEFEARVDSQLLSDTGTITIKVGQVTAYDDYYTTSAGTTVTGNILSNDLPSTPGVLAAFLDYDRPHHHGTLELTADGNFTYTPDSGFVGVETFGYWVTRSYGGELDKGTVSITVGDPGGPPTATLDTYTTVQNTVLNGTSVLANDTAASILTASLTEEPAHGTLDLAADGTFTYTPDQDFFGSDYFIYTATDQQGRTSVARSFITVREGSGPVDPADAPAAAADSYVTNQDEPLTVSASGVLANDTDDDGAENLLASVILDPGHGDLTLNPDGSFTYTPDTGFAGTDYFNYYATDPGGLVASATVTITVNAINHAPAAGDAEFATAQDTSNWIDVGVLAATDPDGDTLTFTKASDPAHGSVTVAGSVFTYTPEPGFFGTDSFTYTATDPDGLSDTGTLTVTVFEANTPIAGDDSYTVGVNKVLTVAAPGVLGNDTIPQDPNQSMYAEVASGPAHGTLELNRDGSFTYTPDEGFSGTDSFTYKANDPGYVGFAPLTAQRFAPLALAAAATPAETGTVTLTVQSTAADSVAGPAENSGVAGLPPTGAPAGARQLLPLSFLFLAGGLLLVVRRRGLGR